MLARKDLRQALAAILAISIVVLYILVLLGCNSTSPGIPGLYVVRLANNQTKAAVHVGLLSLCAGTGTNLTCAGTLGQAANASSAKFYLPGTATAGIVAPAALQPLLALAAGIQSSSTGPGGVLAVVYVPLLFSALCFVAAAGSLVAMRVIARRGGGEKYDDGTDDDDSAGGGARSAWRAAVLLTTGAIMAALAAAIATTVAVRALQFASTTLPGTAPAAATAKSTTAIDVTSGTSVQVLQWLIVVLTLLWHPMLEPLWRKVL